MCWNYIFQAEQVWKFGWVVKISQNSLLCENYFGRKILFSQKYYSSKAVFLGEKSCLIKKNKITIIAYIMKACLKFPTFIFWISSNLAKYTYEWSPSLEQHHKIGTPKKILKKKTTHSWNKKKREKKLKYLGPSNEDLKKTGPKSPLTLSVHLGNPKHHHVKTKRGGKTKWERKWVGKGKKTKKKALESSIRTLKKPPNTPQIKHTQKKKP